MQVRLFYKLAAVFFLTGLIVVAIAAFLLERELKDLFSEKISEEMRSEARLIAQLPPADIAAKAAELAGRSRSRLTLIAPDGRVLADSEAKAEELENHLLRSEIQDAARTGLGTAVRYSQTIKKEMLYVAAVLREDSQIKGFVRLARPLSELDISFEEIRAVIFDVLLLIVAICLLIGLFFVMKMVAPVRTLAAFTEKIRSGVLAGQVKIDSRDELGVLARNINDMVASLQEKIKQADAEKGKLQALFAAMVEGIMVLDGRGRIETVNRGMEEMLGVPAADLKGRTPLEVFRSVELHETMTAFRRSGRAESAEISLADRQAVLEVTISAISGKEEGKTLLVFHDVTRLKRLERIRTDFVANVTHEIKTPLTAILGFVETILAGVEKEKALHFLETIRDNARRLNRLVDDLLVLSSLELGETKLKKERLSLAEALEGALAVMTPALSEKGLKLAKTIPPDLPAVLADADRLAQVFLNILDNAVKFTPPGGGITVAAQKVPEGFVTVRITDTGIGIPLGEIPRLGERFYRVDKTRSRKLGGTGLGLSIVKHIMSLHGGSMRIESRPGSGTTVTLAFPLSEATSAGEG